MHGCCGRNAGKRMPPNLLVAFPNLSTGNGYIHTSDATPTYNCIAHAFGDQTRRWEPDPLGICYWPPGLTRTSAMSGFNALCKSRGYQRCTDGNLEPSVEKLAIYVVHGRFTHIARQLPDGRWTSKLGNAEDITHDLSGLENSSYGTVTIYFKKPRAEAQ